MLVLKEYFTEYFTLGGCVLVLKEVKYSIESIITTLTENISLWEDVMVLKENFMLGGCTGAERS